MNAAAAASRQLTPPIAIRAASASTIPAAMIHGARLLENSRQAAPSVLISAPSRMGERLVPAPRGQTPRGSGRLPIGASSLVGSPGDDASGFAPLAGRRVDADRGGARHRARALAR